MFSKFVGVLSTIILTLALASCAPVSNSPSYDLSRPESKVVYDVLHDNCTNLSGYSQEFIGNGPLEGIETSPDGSKYSISANGQKGEVFLVLISNAWSLSLGPSFDYSDSSGLSSEDFILRDKWGCNDLTLSGSIDNADALLIADRAISKPESFSQWTDQDHETWAARKCLAIKDVVYAISLDPTNLKVHDEFWTSIMVHPTALREPWGPIMEVVIIKQMDNWGELNGYGFQMFGTAQGLTFEQYLEKIQEYEWKSYELCAGLGIDLQWWRIAQ